MKGRYRGVQVVALLLNDKTYRQEAGAWVEWPMTGVLSTLFAPYDTRNSQEFAAHLMDELRDPLYVVFPGPFSRYRSHQYLPMPIQASPRSPEVMRYMGAEALDGVSVTHYAYIACIDCSIDMPRYAQYDVWLDPRAAQIHKVSSTPSGWSMRLAPAESGDSAESEMTISRHNDPAIKLPVP